MGFEVIYSYHERGEDGNYNKEETKTLKKRVGDPYDDVPLEKLAGAIMAQLARRDVWVVDVEVNEFAKKKLTFRETKGGVVIGNKKFMFDGDAQVTMQEVAERPSVPAPTNGQHPHEALRQQPHQADQPQIQARPLKFMTFAPELHQMMEIKQKGLRLTPDKRYPVFSERQSPNGVNMIFKVKDDLNRDIDVSDIYFIPAGTNLFGDKELGFSNNPSSSEGGKLDWSGAIAGDNVPAIR